MKICHCHLPRKVYQQPEGEDTRLTQVTAFILLKMDEGLKGEFVVSGKSSPIGYGGTQVAASSRDRNQIEALRRELEHIFRTPQSENR